MWLYYMTVGLALILFGLLIVVVPQLLAVLVAICVILVGSFFVVLGWRLRRARSEVHSIHIDDFEI